MGEADSSVDTSKLNVVGAYGRNGAFLASLASLSLLTITSHHQAHRSTHSITFQKSSVVARLSPAPASYGIVHSHGTKVAVRDLFGNMPVRVKQRAMSLEDRGEYDRCWESLKRRLAALFLAYGSSVALKLSDVNQLRSCTISELRRGDRPGLSQLSSNRSMLHVLSRFGLVPPGNASWVPTSASSKSISIKGSICLQPAPSKTVQFISLAHRPLLKDSGPNELYDHINALFKRSSFGVIDGPGDGDEEVKERTLKAREKRALQKGVDRWPMFHLRIVLKDDKPNSTTDEVFRSGRLAAVTNVLDTLVNAWLQAHHFRSQPAETAEPDETKKSNISSYLGKRKATDNGERGSRSGTPARSDRSTRKKAKPSAISARSQIRPTTAPSFSDFTRVKSSDRSIFEFSKLRIKGSSRPLSAPSYPAKEPLDTRETEAGGVDDHRSLQLPASAHPSAFGRGSCCHPEEASQDAELVPPNAEQAPQDAEQVPEHPHQTDNIIKWTDPITDRSHKVNARTGAAILPTTSSSTNTVNTYHPNLLRSIRLPSQTSPTKPTPFLDTILSKWANPTFASTSRPIPQSSIRIPHAPGPFTSTPNTDMATTFTEASLLRPNKLTKPALTSATVIAQVDRKFILLKLPSSSATGTSTLVMLDQHAASERVGVEALLASLCTPPKGPVLRSALGHVVGVDAVLVAPPLVFQVPANEAGLFTRYAGVFARWGILYDVQAGSGEVRLSVTALPPVIAERLRLEPRVLIELLRKEAWGMSEGGVRWSQATAEVEVSEEGGWLGKIGACPAGILDLVNSRACRSAVMFNDELSMTECKRLVGELAGTAFPFQCAHGRPSMGSFIEAWRKWKKE
ncbi:hypothetical protein EJ06DRAFT_77932 [Trichodelitschia bisporula]|uniref:MutL C-terminal dimerisation domain-containing protein n=1 Tax=Trichodelitschia bisporula TaxID=703511 RepID=A0A6G1HTS9_9PEZI|nr:hypothetical protein EJ06DRAFT_77932 [Trichodelitschia bisporula]